MNASAKEAPRPLTKAIGVVAGLIRLFFNVSRFFRANCLTPICVSRSLEHQV